MENPSTSQNSGSNQSGGGTQSSNVGAWQRSHQEAVNSQPNDDTSVEDPGNEEIETAEDGGGEEEKNENKKNLGISALISKGVGQVEDAARQATGEALRQSWINLFTTYGLTFLYINFHFIFAYLGGPFARFFPKAGREWLSKFTKGLPVPEQFKKDIEETAGASIAPFELGLVILVDVLIILLILIILFIGYILITESPASLMYHAAVESLKGAVGE